MRLTLWPEQTRHTHIPSYATTGQWRRNFIMPISTFGIGRHKAHFAKRHRCVLLASSTSRYSGRTLSLTTVLHSPAHPTAFSSHTHTHAHTRAEPQNVPTGLQTPNLANKQFNYVLFVSRVIKLRRTLKGFAMTKQRMSDKTATVLTRQIHIE